MNLSVEFGVGQAGSGWGFFLGHGFVWQPVYYTSGSHSQRHVCVVAGGYDTSVSELQCEEDVT